VKYHDYHLQGYTVAGFGRKITLHLVFDYPGKSRDESYLEFSGVALYHFVHTGGAIVTDIEETPLSALLVEIGDSLVRWQAAYGVSGWQTSLERYHQFLEAGHTTSWRIETAIGFYGFTIPESVRPLPPTESLGRSDDSMQIGR
jgi:hypothetical protein